MIDSLKIEIETAMHNIEITAKADETAKKLIHMLNIAELGRLHLEFMLKVLTSGGSAEDIAAIKEKYSSISYRYENLKTIEDVTPVPTKYAIVIMHDKMFLEFQRTLRNCFKKTRSGELELDGSEENIARIEIIVWTKLHDTV